MKYYSLIVLTCALIAFGCSPREKHVQKTLLIQEIADQLLTEDGNWLPMDQLSEETKNKAANLINLSQVTLRNPKSMEAEDCILSYRDGEYTFIITRGGTVFRLENIEANQYIQQKE